MFELSVAYTVTHRMILAVMSPDGKTTETGESIEALRTHYPDAQTGSAYSAQRAIEDTYLTGPVEISSEDYDDALGAVPPRYQRGDDFIAGELYYGTVGIFYTKSNGRSFKLFQRVNTPFPVIHQMVADHIANSPKAVAQEG